MEAERPLVTPLAHDALSARLIARTGFKAFAIGGSALLATRFGLPDIGPPTNLYNVYAGELTLSYTFDLFGAVRYGVRQAAAQVDLQSYEFSAAQRALAANIVIGAVNAAALAEALTINERLAQLAHEQAQLTEKAYRSGSTVHDALLTAQQNAAALDADETEGRGPFIFFDDLMRHPRDGPFDISLVEQFFRHGR